MSGKCDPQKGAKAPKWLYPLVLTLVAGGAGAGASRVTATAAPDAAGIQSLRDEVSSLKADVSGIRGELKGLDKALDLLTVSVRDLAQEARRKKGD